MHNMIVEEEFVEEEFMEEDFVEGMEEDLQNSTSTFFGYDGPVDDQSNRIPSSKLGEIKIRNGSPLQS